MKTFTTLLIAAGIAAMVYGCGGQDSDSNLAAASTADAYRGTVLVCKTRTEKVTNPEKLVPSTPEESAAPEAVLSLQDELMDVKKSEGKKEAKKEPSQESTVLNKKEINEAKANQLADITSAMMITIRNSPISAEGQKIAKLIFVENGFATASELSAQGSFDSDRIEFVLAGALNGVLRLDAKLSGGDHKTAFGPGTLQIEQTDHAVSCSLTK